MTVSGKHFVQNSPGDFGRENISAVFSWIFRFLDFFSGVATAESFRAQGLGVLVLVAPANH